jgi:hypothetical protein
MTLRVESGFNGLQEARVAGINVRTVAVSCTSDRSTLTARASYQPLRTSGQKERNGVLVYDSREYPAADPH